VRVAAYVRVSTDEQADKGNSLLEQRERLEAYCKAMGWNKPVFFEDDGYSAKDMRRPNAQKMIDRVSNNEFDIVLTSKLDRMSRNLLDMLQFVKLLEDHNCSYVSSSEGFDTSTAVGRMVLQLLAAFAEFERERTRERVKDNMMSLARNTDKVITLPCYGYDIVEGKYAINDQEAQFIQLMFELAEQGHGPRMIAKILNDRGATTKRGKPWDQVNVKRLIHTETIYGTVVYNKRQNKNGKLVIRDKSEWIVKEGNHPAIISAEKRNRVLEILEGRKRARKHADSETYLLTGLVKCAHCGRNMKGNTARYKRQGKTYDYFRYVCASYVNGYGCKYHAVHRDDLENEIMSQIERVARTSTGKLELDIAHTSVVADEIEDIKSQLAKIDKRMQKQIDAYTNDLISDGDLKIASEKAEKERAELRSKLEKAQSQKVDVDGIKQNVERLMGEITGEDRVKAKAAIRQLIERIDISNGETGDIVWKPFF